jgi:hypothetical protein
MQNRTDTAFAGSIPEIYDRCLGPMIVRTVDGKIQALVVTAMR